MFITLYDVYFLCVCGRGGGSGNDELLILYISFVLCFFISFLVKLCVSSRNGRLKCLNCILFYTYCIFLCLYKIKQVYFNCDLIFAPWVHPDIPTVFVFVIMNYLKDTRLSQEKHKI
jgi:hypothetical protein